MGKTGFLFGKGQPTGPHNTDNPTIKNSTIRRTQISYAFKRYLGTHTPKVMKRSPNGMEGPRAHNYRV